MRRTWIGLGLGLAVASVVIALALAFRGLGGDAGDVPYSSGLAGAKDAADNARLTGGGRAEPVARIDASRTSGLLVLVTDEQGGPVAGVRVEAVHQLVWRGPWYEDDIVEIVPSGAATTDGAGRALLAPLPEGRWQVRAWDGAHGRVSRLARRVFLSPGPPVEVHLILGASHGFEGTVRDESGAPVAGAQVLLNPIGASMLRRVAATGGEGRFAFAGLAPGLYRLGVAGSGDMYRGRGVIAIPDVSVRDLILEPAAVVRGRVTSSDGSPLEGAIVSVGTSTDLGRAHREATTDADGHYRIEGVPPMQNTRITAQIEGYIPFEEENDALWFYVPAGTERVFDMTLRRGAALTGVVRGPEGAVVVGALVDVHGKSAWGYSFVREGRTDAEGRYRFDAVPTGYALLRVFAAGLHQPGRPESAWRGGRPAAGRTVQTPVSGVVTADVTLAFAASVEGTCLDATGAPAVGAIVALHERRGPRVAAGADGRFVLPDVPTDGAVVLAVTPAGGGRLLLSDPLDPEPGEVLTGLVLTLPPALVVRGVLRGPNGSVPDGAIVRRVMLEERLGIHDSEWAWQADGYPVSADGAFEIPLVGTERYFAVRGAAPGLTPFTSDPIPIAEGTTTYEVTLALEGAVPCTVRILDRTTGMPLPGTRVHVKGLEDRIHQLEADANGALTLQLREGIPFTLAVAAPGYIDEYFEELAPGTTDLVVELAPALTIEGRVVDEGGVGIAYVRVTANPVEGRRWRAARTTHEGSFVVRGLGAGTHRLTVAGDTNRPGGGAVLPVEVGEVEAGTSGLRIQASRGERIEGRVVDETGAGLANVHVHAKGSGPHSRSRAQTRADGTFVFEALPPDVYGLFTRRTRGYLPAQVLGVDAGTLDVELVLHVGLAISGRAVDGGGEPISGRGLRWSVRFEGEDSFTSRGDLAADGSFTAEGLSPGTYRVEIYDRDGGPRLPGVVAGVAAGTRDLRIPLEAAGAISGRVVDLEGNPVFEIEVQFFREGEGGSPWWRMPEFATYTDDEGRFRQEGLQPDRTYLVIAGSWDMNWTRSGRRRVECGTEDLRFQLRKGRAVEGVLLDAAGEAVEDAAIAVIGEYGLPLMTAESGVEGKFVIHGLPPTPVTVFAVAVGPSGEHVPIGTVKGGDTGVVLRLPR